MTSLLPQVLQPGRKGIPSFALRVIYTAATTEAASAALEAFAAGPWAAAFQPT